MTAFGETLVQGIAFFLLASLLVAGIWIGASAFEAAAYPSLTCSLTGSWTRSSRLIFHHPNTTTRQKSTGRPEKPVGLRLALDELVGSRASR